ncbi:hypothetical protein LSM04_005307 [Trypanosoma melophagium]|uniref:uncharacterized protein n=1 Tax=Trypanosoma melophagium TaxID=715481 RepID=UPI00351A03D5|nr:hypothetical protein LSM04_005307 [Trypanosoma melophagium]
MTLYVAPEYDYSWHAMPEWVRRRGNASRRQSQRRSINEYPSQSGMPDAWGRKSGTLSTQPEYQQQQRAASLTLQDNSGIMGANERQNDEMPPFNKKGLSEENGKGARADYREGRKVSLKRLSAVKGLGLATHTVRFHGPMWKSVLQDKPSEVESAFKKDVMDITELEEQRIEDLTIEYKGMLVARFTVNHDSDEDEMMFVHTTLQTYDFPHMLILYPDHNANK